MGILVIVCVQLPSHHFLQTFWPLRMLLFTIVFRDGSLYPKQLFLFCLISARADRIGYCCTSSKQQFLTLKHSGIS